MRNPFGKSYGPSAAAQYGNGAEEKVMTKGQARMVREIQNCDSCEESRSGVVKFCRAHKKPAYTKAYAMNELG